MFSEALTVWFMTTCNWGIYWDKCPLGKKWAHTFNPTGSWIYPSFLKTSSSLPFSSSSEIGWTSVCSVNLFGVTDSCHILYEATKTSRGMKHKSRVWGNTPPPPVWYRQWWQDCGLGNRVIDCEGSQGNFQGESRLPGWILMIKLVARALGMVVRV